MSNIRAHVDIESFSELNVTKVGAYRYAEDSSTEILVLGYAIGDDPVQLWIPWDTDFVWIETVEDYFCESDIAIHWGPECPRDLAEIGAYAAHNSMFERVMLNGRPGQDIGFPRTTIEQWICTAAKAASHNLPRALKDVGQALRLEELKHEEFKRSMQKLVKPRKPSKKDPRTRWTTESAPADYLKMYVYNIDDVKAERAVDHALPDLPPLEQRMFWIDQQINERGVPADVPLVTKTRGLIQEWRGKLEEACIDVCGVKPTQTAEVTKWVQDRYPLSNLQKDTVAEALQDPEMPAEVRKVLRLRKSHAMKAVDKYKAILDAVTAAGKLHGMFLFCGAAATGRWSGRLVQLQNLYRGHPDVDPELAVRAIESGDLAWIRAMWDIDPMLVFASCIRAMLISGDDHDLLACDYNSIEARIIAWLAGQEDVLEVFRTHGLIYEHTAAKGMGLDHTDVEGVLRPMKKVDPDARQFRGKIPVLAFGFQGGAGAYMRSARKNGIFDIEERFAEQQKYDWRNSNPMIVQLWYGLDDAALEAVRHPGVVTRYRKIAFKVAGDFLYMRLPSGRRLAYHRPDIEENDFGEQVTFMGIDTETRRYCRTRAYGGVWANNATQGTAADIMRNGIIQCETAPQPYPVIMTVHDEAVSRVKKGTGSPEEMSELMCRLPEWAEGLPVAADGFRATRYRKD